MNAFRKSIVLVLVFNILLSCKKDEIPVVDTSSISNISGTSAISGGTITSEGTENVVSRGICWSTEQNPTISDNITSDGIGPGAFTSNLSGLNGATMYYVRAYATNNIGTGYGMAISFTTLGDLPISTATGASNISNTGATLNGSVNPNYLSTIVSFEYGTSTSYGHTGTATQSPVNGDSQIEVSLTIADLTPGALYHYRIKAVNSVGTGYSEDITFTTSGVKDHEGTLYNTIIIGNQVWMADNLKTIHYNDGSSIPLVASGTPWGSASEGGYCIFGNYSPNLPVYGALYNWYTINTGKICPIGWHVPTSNDWLTLIDHLGGESVAGGKMKEVGLTRWTSPNNGADNSSGFTSPGGSFIDFKGVFGVLGSNAYYWSSTEVSTSTAIANKLFYENSAISQFSGGHNKYSGFSVRCIKD